MQTFLIGSKIIKTNLIKLRGLDFYLLSCNAKCVLNFHISFKSNRGLLVLFRAQVFLILFLVLSKSCFS